MGVAGQIIITMLLIIFSVIFIFISANPNSKYAEPEESVPSYPTLYTEKIYIQPNKYETKPKGTTYTAPKRSDSMFDRMVSAIPITLSYMWGSVCFCLFLPFVWLYTEMTDCGMNEYISGFVSLLLFFLINYCLAIAVVYEGHEKEEKNKNIALEREILSLNMQISQLRFNETPNASASSNIQNLKNNVVKLGEKIRIQHNEIEDLNSKIDLYQSILEEKKQTFPHLAKMFADVDYYCDNLVAQALKNKARPAYKASEMVSQIAKEKQELKTLCKMQEYQLNFYESLFPWLEDFKEVDPKDACESVKTPTESQDEYERLRTWLSPDEYNNLPTSQKYQLALERYKTRSNKTNWQIGIEYERYVGYMYEKKGYRVKYNGALSGLEDMGRDLIAENDNHIIVIQCKRWSKEKTIHEKHIFQLYGTMILLKIENPLKNVDGVFVTSTSLSETAKSCANYLGIAVKENFSYSDYPMIKCNISRKDNEKIYHLPFDQQYDKIFIEPNRGEQYAYTVEEAENAGFRRAFKWHSV